MSECEMRFYDSLIYYKEDKMPFTISWVAMSTADASSLEKEAVVPGSWQRGRDYVH